MKQLGRTSWVGGWGIWQRPMLQVEWLERQTRDWKVAGSNPCHEQWEFFFLQGRLSVLTVLFWYPFHPCVTEVAHKRSWSFCQKCRWQVTAKHAYTLRRLFHEVTWSVVVWCTQDLRRDSCSFMWHQPCQRCNYTTSMDIQKTSYKASHLCITTC